MPTNEARKVDSWDEEVTDVAPKQVDSWDEEVVDEPVKKKVTPSPLQTQSSSNGLNLLSGVIPSGKALLTGQKEESAPTEQKQIDLTNAPIAEDESTRTDKFIRKPIDKKKVDEIYTLSKQNESLVDEFTKSHFVLDNLSQTEAVKQLNDLYAKREQAKDPQIAQAIDNQIEVIKSQPVEKQPSIQEAVLQNAQKYGNQPQDFNRPEIPMNPLTPNQILERNGMKTANTVGELHDRYIESATKLNELRPELDRTATELDAFKKDARTADFKTDKSGNKTLEGLADIPEAFGHGFGGTMKSIEQGFVNLLGDKQDRIDYAKKRYLEDNILYPTRTKGMATSGSEMIGGVAPYVISTAVLPETALLGHVIINGLTMGASGYGNGYYEMFAKQKQQGASDEEADAIAMQNAKFEGAKETAIGASLPFMGGAGSKLFLAPAEKSAMKQFLATQGVIIPTFTAGKLASNVYQKYGLGEKDVNLGDGLAETAENGLILGAMMEFAHKAPPKLKELYRANLSEQYPSIQQSVDKAVKDGVMDASQGYAFTEKLKRDFAVFNAMPKDITTEQKLAIEPEVKQIIELSSREPSEVESPEVTKDKIVQLQKQVAEKLGTPLTEKEQKAYEKLLERQKPIKSESGKEITLELLPSEKAELNHYEKRIKTAEDIEAKLAEEKKVAEAEAPLTNVGVVEGSVGVGGDVVKGTKVADKERRRKEELFDILSEEDKQIALKIPEGDKRNKWVKTRVSKTTKGNDAIERHNAEDALNTSTDVATRIAAKRKLESNQPFNAGSISDINNVIFKIKNDDVLIGSEKLIKDYYDAELKALEQKQSTETKVEASNTSNVEEGSGGVGGDVESTTKVIEDGDKWYKAEKSVKDKDGNDITLTIDKNKDTNHFYIKAKDNKGNEIGSALFETDNGKVWSGNEIEVNEGNRRKGIMSEIYDFAESEGHPLEPTKSLSKEGKAFWENRKSQTLLSKEQTIVEQPQDETLVTEEAVSETKVKEPIPNDIKTAIDNGEITREQVDGFIEQDESVITDIERKAESENEAELNEAIDQADKLIGEAVGATEGEKQPTDKGTSEDKVTGIKKAMVEKDRADAGLPPIELPKSNKPQEQLERAKELVDSGEVDPSELEAYLISHAENPSDAKTSESDQYVLQYQRMKIDARSKEILTERMAIEDRLKEDPTDVQANLDLASNEIARQQNIYDLDRNTTASRVTSSIWGKLGNAKQQVINERGIVQEQINRIKELHGKDVPKEVQDKLDSLEKKNTELTARIEAIEKNITEQIAQGQLNKESRKPLIRRTSRRSVEEINAQIKDKLSTIANKIAERIEKSAVKNFAANKEQSKSLIADIAPDVMDVVKLVSEKTGNKLEDVVNKTYDAIKDIAEGIGKRDIVDIIAGKYSDKKPLSELQKQINDIRSQARLNERIDELEKGILRETQKRGESSEEVKKLRERANELMKKNKNDLATFSANELKKQVEQLQKKINKGEFLPQKTVKKAFEQDANWVKYSQEKKKLKQELNHLEAQALYDKKNLYMKTLDQFNKFSRLGLFIFSTAYQLKLAAAALSTIAHKPIEDLVGTAIKPMVKEIADRAPIEGRNINAEATAEFYKNLSPIKILRGAYQILSKGESDLSRELSSHPKKEGNIFNPLSDHSVLNWIADDPHKIIKNPIKQGIFDASLANYMNYYASKGMDINDPILIEKARQASYMRAEYEIFMGGENSKTAVSEWFKKMESEGILDAQSESFKTKVGGNLKYSISALKNFIVPIASVPANILNRTVKNNPISTAYRFSEALKTNSELKNNITETLDNLTEAQADLMLRDLKKGAIGSVYWTLGFIMAGNALGGFFNKSYPDKKRDKDEKKHDEMEIFGKNIPHGVQHAVPLQQMQMAATFALTLKYFNEQDKKKLKDDFGLKDEIKNAGAGGAEVARTYINEHPMSKASLDIVKALEGGKGREKYFNSLERRSDIPQTKFLLQDIGLIEKDDSYEKQKAKSKKHNEVKDLYDVFWYMMDDKKFENHNE